MDSGADKETHGGHRKVALRRERSPAQSMIGYDGLHPEFNGQWLTSMTNATISRR
jgi:hypothetical protein